MKKLLMIATAICVFFCLTLQVSADQQDNGSAAYDWDNTDWSAFDWTDMEEADYFNSLCNWLENDASLHSLFMVNMHCPSTSFYSLWRWTFDRFAANPEEFICVLALENKDTQQRIIEHVIRPVDIDWKDAVAVLESVQLSDSDPEEAHLLLNEMISFAEGVHGVDIENPKTADPFGSVAMTMVLSVCSILGLLWIGQKRKV